MDNICFINGSPRSRNSTSRYLTEEIIKTMDTEKSIKEIYVIDILKDMTLIKEIEGFNKLIFVTPLYVDSLPACMIEFLRILEKYTKKNDLKNIDIYAVVNCGFLEGKQNHIALDIIKNFCDRANLNWRFGVGIGAGEFMKASKSIPINFSIKKGIYEAILKLSYDIQGKIKYEGENLFVNPSLGKVIFKVTAHKYWTKRAKKNNVKKDEIKYSPYEF